ncbi:hypothetical protein GWK47_035121 [Chionoecetes opilio]|uniref:Uncharacterized protein n=1 Tax=Chionoecetes opilio TaxID=41210 RepID=A0A8J4YFM5_CHIOP|nr:hypothetical protein GWK47_035121 [Chionoecetes opilio]
MDLTTKEHVDRLPIIISGIGGAQLLAVAKLGSGTGESMAAAVVSALETWGVADQVVGMSFDTTASNTGPQKRACVLIEQKMGKDLLHFACRHHILELVVHAVFVRVLGVPHRPSICSSNASKPHGRASTERTSARESWWRKWRLF